MSHKQNHRKAIMMIANAGAVTALVVAATGTTAGTSQAANVGTSTAVYYTICVTTANLPAAGTDSQVKIRLRGSLDTSPFLGPLDNPNRDDFEIGSTDCFGPFVLGDVGTYRSVDVRYTRLSGDENHEWNLAHVTVSAPGRVTAYFPHNKWFKKSDMRTITVA
jgi:hypothetical protein